VVRCVVSVRLSESDGRVKRVDRELRRHGP
jgi:hypothetical protein